MRFRFVELFFVIGMIGLGVAGATQAGEYQTALIVALAQLALAIGLLRAIATSGHRRFFWIGFFVTGVIYLYMASPNHNGSARIFTQLPIDYAFQKIHPDEQVLLYFSASTNQ